MALLQNGTINAQYPRRLRGGTFADSRSMWGRGDRLNQGVGEGITDALSNAVPSGHLAPSAWILPTKPGGMSAFTGTAITFSLGDLVLAEGRNLTGDVTFSLTVPDASLELVVSASGSTTITWTPTGNLAGSIAAAGSTTITTTVGTATLGAIADLLATVGITFSGSAIIRATGNLAGNITPFTELSPQSLASAVWAALSADNNLTGTMGRLLNSSGGGSDPDTIAAAVWAAVSRTLTGVVDANVTKVNSVTVDGTGTSGDPWGPA